jgi:DNA/RNA-binding domain of Phe-tRNA-synthetase-like protein
MARGDAAQEPRAGAIAPGLAAELPGLALRWVTARAAPGPSAPGVRARLRALSDRHRGIDAVALRTRPIPRAYRTFFRQIGLDPDLERIPAEAAAVQRLMDGGLRARERIADACLVAVVETGVGVWALDGNVVAAPGPEIRLARADEPAPGSLVVADARGVLAPLLRDPLPAAAPGPRTRVVVLYAVGVPGVPEIHLHEALWQARDAVAPDHRSADGALDTVREDG